MNPPPPGPLRCLVIEDSAIDAELLLAALRQGGFTPESSRIETEAEFVVALDKTVQVVIADYSLPGWNGLAVLESVKSAGLDIPVIIVSGAMGDEVAAAVMKQGAADFLLKDRLSRLAAAVTHAIDDAQLRREHRAEQAALRIAHAQLSQLLEHSPAVLYSLAGNGNKSLSLAAGESLCRLLGLPDNKRITFDWWLERLHPADRQRALDSVPETLSDGLSRTEYRILHEDGDYRWIDDTRRAIYDIDGATFELVGVWSDVTERKHAEAERERLIEELQAAQTTVKHLNGLLPVCASCKNIRDKAGHWHRLEAYIRDHSEAEVTHGMCPDCVRQLYPSLADQVVGKRGDELP